MKLHRLTEKYWPEATTWVRPTTRYSLRVEASPEHHVYLHMVEVGGGFIYMMQERVGGVWQDPQSVSEISDTPYEYLWEGSMQRQPPEGWVLDVDGCIGVIRKI
jgi:hypothetical protein